MQKMLIAALLTLAFAMTACKGNTTADSAMPAEGAAAATTATAK